MPKRKLFSQFLLALFLIGCALGPAVPELGVSWEGGGRGAPRVGAVVVRGIAGLQADDIWLVRGKLNDKALLGVVERAPADSVLERRVPAFVRIREAELAVLPTVRLEAAEIYSVVAQGFGLVTVFETRAASPPVYSRVGSALLSRSGRAVYCIMDGPLPRTGALLESEEREVDRQVPSGSSVRVMRGVGTFELFDDSCIQIELPSDEALPFFLPPREAFGFEIDPAPVLLTDVRTSLDPCGGESCLSVGHSAIGSTIVPSLGFLEGRTAGGESVRAFAAGVRLRTGSLSPETDYDFEAVFEVNGTLFEEAGTLNSGAAEAIFILNEVLANPNGPEPQSEWVEIANAGSREASLGGYRLVDAGGESILPAVSIAPGGFGVVVRSDYQPNPALDPVPLATAVPIVVPAIGDGGLRNDGELLELRDPAGVLISQIPRLKANPGKSSARVGLLAPDVPESFVSVEPTPGGPNGTSE